MPTRDLAVRHPSFRRPFTSIPSFLLQSLLHLSPSSPTTQSLSLFLTFGLSALLHAFSSFVMARTGLGSLKFFLIQPIGIILERIVSSRVTGGLKSTRTAIGYVWTAGWLLYWCPWFFDELVQVSSCEVFFLMPRRSLVPVLTIYNRLFNRRAFGK